MTLDAAGWRSLTTHQRLGHLVLLFLKSTPPYAVAGSILGVTVGVAVSGALGRVSHRVDRVSHRGGFAKTGGIAGGAVGIVFGMLAGLSEALLGMLKIATDDGSRHQHAQQHS